MGFDVRRYIELSRPLETSDLDWSLPAENPPTDDEARAIAYFAAVEAYTPLWARDLLATRTADDAAVAAFIPCWAYEEAYHGRALQRWLSAARGDPTLPIERLPAARRTLFEHASMVAARIAGAVTRHLGAIHMTWGAFQELIADAAYERLRERARCPVLRELLPRMRKDERRHFAFYFDQAVRRLEDSRVARALTRGALSTLWEPVGSGIAEREEIDTAARLLFSGGSGLEAARAIDARVSSLPGLEGLRLFERAMGRIQAGSERASMERDRVSLERVASS